MGQNGHFWTPRIKIQRGSGAHRPLPHPTASESRHHQSGVTWRWSDSNGASEVRQDQGCDIGLDHRQGSAAAPALTPMMAERGAWSEATGDDW